MLPGGETSAWLGPTTESWSASTHVGTSFVKAYFQSSQAEGKSPSPLKSKITKGQLKILFFFFFADPEDVHQRGGGEE